jgi:hypothetical protein
MLLYILLEVKEDQGGVTSGSLTNSAIAQTTLKDVTKSKMQESSNIQLKVYATILDIAKKKNKFEL